MLKNFLFPYLKAYKQTWLKMAECFFFYFLVPKSLYTKFGYKWPSGFREKQVLISYVNSLEPSSRNDLVLEYSHIVVNSINCLHLHLSGERLKYM